ncbi:MAG: cytochrome c biogenesis protein ResB [Cyanobacteria bacterium P01_A01_bin.37]
MVSSAYRFLGSIKLAVPLLAAIVGILIWATLYESTVGSALVQQEVYKSPWFGALMFMLAMNLGVSAISRYPWKGTRKVGFALAHLGLIVLIAGSAAVIHLSVEGMMLLRTDQGANSLVRVDGDLLDVVTPDGQSVQTDLMIKPDNSIIPSRVAGLTILGYEENTIRTVSFEEGETVENPAVRISLKSDRMGQLTERWLAASPSMYQQENLGPVQLELVRVSSDDVLHHYLAAPDAPAAGRFGTLTVTVDGNGRSLDIESSLQMPVEVTPDITLTVMEFWPDFRLDAQNQPATASQQLRNPAVQLDVSRGENQERWFVFASSEFDPVRTVVSGSSLENIDIQYAAQPQRQQNLFQVIAAPNEKFFYTAQSSKAFTSGSLDVGQPISPGWVDFQITLEDVVSHAVPNRQVIPVDANEIQGSPALQVATPDGETHWLTWAEPTTLSTPSGDYFAAFSPKMLQLPFAVALDDFIVERNEGSESVAMWTSQIQIQDAHRGELSERRVWMNHPTWYQGWKMAQASWNPGDLRQSTLQVKREPWWVTALTWSGSLLVVMGIVVMFYGASVVKAANKILPTTSTDPSMNEKTQGNAEGDRPPVPAPALITQD